MNVAQLFYPIVPHPSLSWTLNFHKSSCESFSITALEGCVSCLSATQGDMFMWLNHTGSHSVPIHTVDSKRAHNPQYCTFYPPGKGLKCHQASCRLMSPHQSYCHPSSPERPPRDPPALLSLPQWDRQQSRTGSTAVKALNCLPLACQPASVPEKGATHTGKSAALPRRRPSPQRLSTTRWMRRLWEQ